MAAPSREARPASGFRTAGQATSGSAMAGFPGLERKFRRGRPRGKSVCLWEKENCPSGRESPRERGTRAGGRAERGQRGVAAPGGPGAGGGGAGRLGAGSAGRRRCPVLGTSGAERAGRAALRVRREGPRGRKGEMPLWAGASSGSEVESPFAGRCVSWVGVENVIGERLALGPSRSSHGEVWEALRLTAGRETPGRG